MQKKFLKISASALISGAIAFWSCFSKSSEALIISNQTAKKQHVQVTAYVNGIEYLLSGFYIKGSQRMVSPFSQYLPDDIKPGQVIRLSRLENDLPGPVTDVTINQMRLRISIGDPGVNYRQTQPTAPEVSKEWFSNVSCTITAGGVTYTDLRTGG